MGIRLNHPQRVILDSILVASNFLLLKSPLRKLNLVREQVTAGECMPQPELGPQGPKTLSCLAILLVAFVNLDNPKKRR